MILNHSPEQLLHDRLVTGTRNGKVCENLLKEKKLTSEKALDIACAVERQLLRDRGDQLKVVGLKNLAKINFF